MSLCDKRQVSKLRQQKNVLFRLEPLIGSHHFTKNRRFLVRLTLCRRWILPRRVVRERTAGAQRDFWAHCASLRGLGCCLLLVLLLPEQLKRKAQSVFQVIWKGINPSEQMLLSHGESLFLPLLTGPLSISMIVSASCLAWRSFCVCPSLAHPLQPDFLLILAARELICCGCCGLLWSVLVPFYFIGKNYNSPVLKLESGVCGRWWLWE